ncbi:uncharacterized protein LOC109834072 [Asparagus officinalis]|uniref:uncharacterized protein LOC109834072 n=1 Tax=Asparagus officinalis TaxID=4686 RepID=UPI00098E0360|nr:uncharacterized protein LOC109834072 [Asparagus officinalis]
MSSSAAGAGAASKKVLLSDDVPWRASPSGTKPLPRIHHNPILKLPQNPSSTYALAVMKHRDPIGEGFATEARLEAAGPECVVPGLATPVKFLGLKVWPVEVDLKFLEPMGRELKAIGKFMDSAVSLMNASFQDR